MSTKLPDVSSDGETRVADYVDDRVETESAAVTTGETAKQCAACGDPDGTQRLLLTVDWVDHLVEKYETDTPEDESIVPLCTRCQSWAEMLEIAEMNVDEHAHEHRRKIREERNRFLDSLRVRSISSFTVTETVHVFEQ